jgi:hypothetical protein
VLILKALHLLRDAQDSDQERHILFVGTSNAVAETVQAAIQAVDDRGLLATTREDRQYLDVTTLHGWCIRELGLNSDARYVLERDPRESKARQHKIISDVFDSVVAKRLPGLRAFLSKDFLSLIEDHRDLTIRELQHEIAIRIKGRGLGRSDRLKYLESSLKTFVGARGSKHDRHLIFHIFEEYEAQFRAENLLDTDDVVLSMSARLSSALWDRQR